MTHGLPGSGKSTWAEEEVRRINSEGGDALRVNRDDIRSMLYGPQYALQKPDKHKENRVSEVEKRLVEDQLKRGGTVINDNTNLNPRFLAGTKKHAEEHGGVVEQRYFDVPVEECKRRNEERGRQGGRLVPEHVIDKMASKGYGEDGRIREFRIGSNSAFAYDRSGSEGERFVQQYNDRQQKGGYPVQSRAVMVVDLDGTLADVRKLSDRYMRGKKKDFHSFHKYADTVPVNEDVLDIIKEARDNDMTVLAVTGRSDDYSRETVKFLDDNDAPVSSLYMRKSGDFRPDYEIKREILADIREEGYVVVHSVDDNPKVLQMWEEEDIPCTVIPFHEPQDPQEAPDEYPKIEVQSPFMPGTCIRCGSRLKDPQKTIGDRCRTKA